MISHPHLPLINRNWLNKGPSRFRREPAAVRTVLPRRAHRRREKDGMSSSALAQNELVLSSRQIDNWSAEDDLAELLRSGWHLNRQVTFSMPPSERAVPICRQLSRVWLDAQDINDKEARHAVLIVVSELTTNAILYSDSTRISDRLWRTGHQVFVEVCDQRRTHSSPHIVSDGESSSHGRGLWIVNQFADKWGTWHTADECAVWAVVALPECVRVSTTCDVPRQRKRFDRTSRLSATESAVSPGRPAVLGDQAEIGQSSGRRGSGRSAGQV